MTGDEAEALALQFLRAFGYEVTRIAEEPGERRADFLAIKTGETILVEVKGKSEDERYRRILLETGEASKLKTMGRTNPISGQIREAITQLRATPLQGDPFRLLILVTPSDDPDVSASQYKSTLYGIVDIVTPSDDGSAVAHPCFYFTFSEFYDAPDIDGAVVIVDQGSRLLVNGFSSRLARFRQTFLYRGHDRSNALDDPVTMESGGKAFIADGPLPRNRPGDVLAYIKTKYRLSVAHNVVFQEHTATVSYPTPRQ